MAQLPFVLSFDSPYYGHDVFPNHIYRRLHPRHHIPLDLHTLGLIARLGAHAHHLHPHNVHRTGELAPIPTEKKDLFEVHLDVGLFQPEEISVKVVDNCVVVEGKHDEREDEHGHIARHFVRRYNVPKGYNPEQIVSTLTADGVLTVRAPKPTKTDDESNEFIVPIQHRGAAELFLHNDGQKTVEENEMSTAGGKN